MDNASMHAPQILQLAAIAVIAGLGAYLDIRWRRLPNWLCLTALAGGLALAFAYAGLQGLSTNALHSVVTLVAGMALFALGTIGAGDAKFYAGMAAWFPLHVAPFLALSVALAGLVLLVSWFSARRIIAAPRTAGAPRDDGPFAKLPFGVAIGVGAAVLQSFSVFGP